MTNWTKIPKPAGGGVTVVTTAGSPIGLLMALTYTTTTSIVTEPWTKISKATGTSWSSVSKPIATSWVSIPKAT